MTTTELPARPPLPAHVPPELVVDWDLEMPGAETDPYGTLAAMSKGPDIVWSHDRRRNRGIWLVKRYEHNDEIFRNPELFSSDRYSGFSAVLGEDWPMIPLEIDPPLHRPFRMMMDKVFKASRIAELTKKIHVLVAEMAEAVRDEGRCEFQHAFGRRLPTTVILELIGLPLEQADQFLAWEEAHMRSTDIDERRKAVRAIVDTLVAAIRDREANPRDDLLTFIAQGEVNGRPITDTEKLGIGFLLYSAGLDTVANTSGFIFRYLAEHPETQALLRERADLRAKALEELLRMHVISMPSRIVTRDIEFHGVPMRKGDYLCLMAPLASRDPEMFPDPDALDLERTNTNRHLAFGTGPHNCMGSHLARHEMRIALDYWLDHMPPFRIDDAAAIHTHGGAVFGVDTLPLAWD